MTDCFGSDWFSFERFVGRLHPATFFSTLNKEEQKRLLEENIVVVNDLWQRKEVVRRIVKDKYDKLFLEIDSL